MKKMITFCLLLCCFYIAGHAQMTTLPPITSPVKVITGNQSIYCTQTNTSLILNFSQSLGEIKITAWNRKIVYGETIYAFTTTTLTVPTSDWNNGNHAICITNSSGKVITTFNVQVQN